MSNQRNVCREGVLGERIGSKEDIMWIDELILNLQRVVILSLDLWGSLHLQNLEKMSLTLV